MIKQYIELGDNGWRIYIYYGVSRSDADDIIDMLIKLGCPKQDIEKSLRILMLSLNTGMTFSNIEKKTSFVCIRKTNTPEQFVNTIVHEAKHIQSHVCYYYGIEEDGETAAYMIGYIVQRMYRMLKQIKQRIDG